MFGIFMECWVSLKLYFGNPLHGILLLLSAIYLAIAEKDLKKRIILGFLPLVVMAGFLFPVTKIVYVAVFDEGSDTYYRLLWLIPSYVVTGYALVKLLVTLENLMKKTFVLWICLAASLLLIAAGGSLVYCNRYMSVAENAYHIPQNVIDICDIISPQKGSRVRAAFPSELVHFVRQYDTDIMMPYGREMIATQWDYYNPVYEVMEKPDEIKASDLTAALRESGCTYVILSSDRLIDEDITSYGYEIVGSVDKYNIYQDTTVDKEG